MVGERYAILDSVRNRSHEFRANAGHRQLIDGSLGEFADLDRASACGLGRDAAQAVEAGAQPSR
jgi:hypothetical protein